MIDIQEVKHRSVKGVVSYALRTLALQAIGFVATVLLGYYLSPADFGIYFIVTAVIGLFTFLSDIGLAAALVQKKEEPTIEELRTTFTVQQCLAVMIFVFILLLTPVWKSQNHLSNNGLELLYALGFSFILASLKTIPSILLERKLAFDKLVIPQIAENLVFYTIAVILAAKGYGVRSYTYAVIARGIIGVLIVYLLQQWPIGFALAKSALKGLLKFGAKFQINDFLARIKDDLFIVILARFVDPTQMGYISWAKRWSLFPYQFSVNSVMSITFPTFARLQDHPEHLKRAVEKTLFFIALIIFPVLVGLSVVALPFTEVIPKYDKWVPALPSLYFFCLNIAFAAVANPLINTLNAIGKINKTLKLMVFWTALTWTLTPLMVLWFSFTGVAIASAVVAASSLLTVILLKKYIPISFFDQLWRQATASLIMGVVLFGLQSYLKGSYLSLFAGIFAGALVYAAILALLGWKKVILEFRSLRIVK